MRSPRKYKICELKQVFDGGWELRSFDGNSWKPARPLYISSLWERLILTWNVFIGKLDVLEWE